MRKMNRVWMAAMAASVGLVAGCGGGGGEAQDDFAESSGWTVNISGIGFVGKGDVQLIYGWSNKQLNDNAAHISFKAKFENTTTAAWECRRTNNDNIQETTTRRVEKDIFLTNSVTRDNKKQVTGFMLSGVKSIENDNVQDYNKEPGTCGAGQVLEGGVLYATSSRQWLSVSVNAEDYFELPAEAMY